MPAGLITIDIEARLAKLEEGVQRSNQHLDRFARTADRAGNAVKRAFAGLASSLTVGAIVLWARESIAAAESLQDLSDATGSTVEALSRLNNITQIGGGNFEEIKGALEKLAPALAGVDDEGGKAAEALRFLGVQSKDPATALEEIAKKLDQFADGANKAAIAKALFGRAGVGFLATLKDIARNGDIAATSTTKQAEEATKLGESYRALSVQSTALRNALLSGIVPALNTIIERMVTAIGTAGSFGQGLEAMFSTAIRPGAVADQLDQVERSLKRLKDEAKEGKFELIPGSRDETIQSLERQKAIILLARQQRALAQAKFSADDSNVRDLLMLRRPEPNFRPSGGGGGGKDRISEAQRYLEALQKQVEKLGELSAVEEVVREIQTGRLKDATNAEKTRAFALAQEIDAFRALEKEIEASNRAFEEQKRLAQEAGAERARAADAVLQSAESWRQANEQLQEEIAIILGGEGARDALQKGYVARALAIKEEALALAELDPLRQTEAENLRAEIAILTELNELLAGRDIAIALRERADAAKALADQFDNAGKSALSRFFQELSSGRPLDALRNLGANAFQGINQIVSDRLAGSIVDGSGIGSFLSSIFGGQASGGVALTGAATALTGAATLLSSAAIALGASGTASSVASIAGAFIGPAFGSFATGTDYVPRTGPYILHKGERVVTAKANRSGGVTNVTIVQNISRLDSTQTGRQAARMAGQTVSMSGRRG